MRAERFTLQYTAKKRQNAQAFGAAGLVQAETCMQYTAECLDPLLPKAMRSVTAYAKFLDPVVMKPEYDTSRGVQRLQYTAKRGQMHTPSGAKA
ncbi:hypothetical protein BaRGS_00010871 [Batillaria attramentaria]|uniref:Uncharacterized protein n=1 Tax=Batillaria attramentaria TaxID=370345 RepID=A0ABD0LF46_9CAEN